MTDIASAPLPALIRYYERLEADPSQSVAGFGFSPLGVSFCVVLEPDGTLSTEQLADLRDEVPVGRKGDRTRRIPRQLIVPFRGNRSGQRPPPNFLCDNSGYVFGKDVNTKAELLKWKHEEFVQLHQRVREQVKDAGLEAVCLFLEKWSATQAGQLAQWDEITGTNLVFRLRGEVSYVHDSPSIRDAWVRNLIADESTTVGVSLVNGKVEKLARLHEPAIKGVIDPGGQAEKRIASFNADAFESYGKTQSFNAPVGVQDAFRYTTALNRLLADDTRKVRIGDATVVFWSDRPEAKDAEDALQAFFTENIPKSDEADDQKTVVRLRGFLEKARQGRLIDEIKDPDAPFYVLGLSPNASRLNVRFWLVGTVAEFVGRLARHVGDLEMVGERDGDPPLVIRRLLLETAREPKDIPPQLAGEVAHAILGGLPYPQILFSAVVRRIRIDTTVNHRRAAILKAFFIRNKKMEVPVALNKDHPDEAYHLGRLFAALEKTQEDATDGKLNSTIKDRYFGAASATPASVFPRILRLHQFHLDKIEHVGQRVNREKLVGEICGHIRRFPSHLTLEKQGLFQIAYYHQRQDFFTKKTDGDKETTNE